MHTNADKVNKVMEELAPKALAESWDNVGLLIGHKNKMIQNILLALEVTDGVIDEAIEKNVDMIIVHHPLIFKPLKVITHADPIGGMAMRLIKNDINVYAAHTNLDAAPQGTSAYLAEVLALTDVRVLDDQVDDHWYKINVYVPRDFEARVKTAMFDYGGGQVDTYDSCAYTLKGQGQFRALEGADPFVGDVNTLTHTEETKIEMAVAGHKIKAVEAAMLQAHPYQVPAYDIIKTQRPHGIKGIGVYGEIKPIGLSDLSHRLKDILGVGGLKFVGAPDKIIHKVSIVTGAGAAYMKKAHEKSDVLITGDVKYHEAQDALQMGLALIDGGHYETEVFYMPRLKQLLDRKFEEKSYDIQVMVSEIDINPFKTLAI